MKYSSFNDVVTDLEKINIKIEKIRQDITPSYNSQDARQVALDGLQMDIHACG